MTAKRILVPVDGSECSIHALEYAARRQRMSEGLDILVLNVQPSIRPSRTLSRGLIAEHQSRNTEAALKPALAAIKRLGLNATHQTQIGNPAEVIVAFARHRKCGEIVMGNSGLGAVAGLLLGSVARKVIFLTRIPVVLVK
jgi:nucleotide-binding universal stress UspA family protein